ncbi:MAG TPA: DUF5682 family protein [Polyangiaceae bacterium]|nr:DUF5682 family protein [Polyangiaceae bacterium]
MGLHVVGVRHHSPACARVVGAAIRALRPRFVLIEGPSDMNERLDELFLAHRLPIALFTYRQDPTGRSRSSWAPFCDYSPEWVALREAREVGATPLFIDLPAWDPAFDGEENRYSDRHGRASDRLGETATALGFEDTDALWDHLFEQPRDTALLRGELSRYFEALRADEAPHAGDGDREAFMSAYVAWALAEAGDGDVLVVCGGFHEPALSRAAAREAQSGGKGAPQRPSAPLPADARIGTYLVPFSFRRLDSFAGYASGMPQPAFYQAVWERGADQAAEAMLFEAIRHLRGKRQRVSPADAIAASTLAHGLRALRGHAALARLDVLDGLAGALVKEALNGPLPWTRRGPLSARTEPLLAEIVHAFAGSRVGTLDPATPRPPLLHDALAELEAAGVRLERVAARLTVRLDEPAGARVSTTLHRLRTLGIPGFALTRGANLSRVATDLSEEWSVVHLLETDPALIEASIYGATLEGAAAARIEERARDAADVGAIADALALAAACGLRTLTERGLADIAARVGAEPSFSALGRALRKLLALRRGELVLGATGQSELPRVLEACFDRGLWLFEGTSGPTAPLDVAHVDAVAALREVLRETDDEAGTMTTRALECCERRSHDPEAPPALRGAALGVLWSMAPHADGDAVHEDHAARARASLRAVARPATFGDFLGGLFALARAEVVRDRSIVATIDASITGFLRDDFLIALPALRQAFAYFPPRERLAIAESVLALGGQAGHDPMALLRAPVDAELVRRGAALEDAARELARRFGLTDALDDAEHGAAS